jgi:hypothetical protein
MRQAAAGNIDLSSSPMECIDKNIKIVLGKVSGRRHRRTPIKPVQRKVGQMAGDREVTSALHIFHILLV